MPPATVGPGAPIDPPLAATLLTVSKDLMVSNSQRTLPSADDNARTTPSQPLENKTPGMAESAASRPPIRPAAASSGANHWRAPSVRRSATTPPLDRP